MEPSELTELPKERRKSITPDELHRDYGIKRTDCYLMKYAINHEEFWDNTKSCEEIEDATGLSQSTINGSRHVLIKYGLIERKPIGTVLVGQLQTEIARNPLKRL